MKRPARKSALPARRPAPPSVLAPAEPRPELRVVRDDEETPATPADLAALRRLLQRVVALAEDLTGRTIVDPAAAVVALELHHGRPR